MSGDMNTALGNCLIMCCLIMCYMDTKNILYDFINNGDDAVIFVEDKYLNLLDDLPNWFRELGFDMKVESPAHTLEEIEFCQMHPIQLQLADYTMVRSYPVQIAKDLICLEPSAFKQWVKSVGKGGQAVTSGVPIYQAFYECLERLGQGGKDNYVGYLADSGFYRMIELGGTVRQCVSDTARVSFWRAFDVTPLMQLALEERFQTLELDDTITEDPEGKFVVSLSY